MIFSGKIIPLTNIIMKHHQEKKDSNLLSKQKKNSHLKLKNKFFLSTLVLFLVSTTSYSQIGPPLVSLDYPPSCLHLFDQSYYDSFKKSAADIARNYFLNWNFPWTSPNGDAFAPGQPPYSGGMRFVRPFVWSQNDWQLISGRVKKGATLCIDWTNCFPNIYSASGNWHPKTDYYQLRIYTIPLDYLSLQNILLGPTAIGVGTIELIKQYVLNHKPIEIIELPTSFYMADNGVSTHYETKINCSWSGLIHMELSAFSEEEGYSGIYPNKYRATTLSGGFGNQEMNILIDELSYKPDDITKTICPDVVTDIVVNNPDPSLYDVVWYKLNNNQFERFHVGDIYSSSFGFQVYPYQYYIALELKNGNACQEILPQNISINDIPKNFATVTIQTLPKDIVNGPLNDYSFNFCGLGTKTLQLSVQDALTANTLGYDVIWYDNNNTVIGTGVSTNVNFNSYGSFNYFVTFKENAQSTINCAAESTPKPVNISINRTSYSKPVIPHIFDYCLKNINNNIFSVTVTKPYPNLKVIWYDNNKNLITPQPITDNMMTGVFTGAEIKNYWVSFSDNNNCAPETDKSLVTLISTVANIPATADQYVLSVPGCPLPATLQGNITFSVPNSNSLVQISNPITNNSIWEPYQNYHFDNSGKPVVCMEDMGESCDITYKKLFSVSFTAIEQADGRKNEGLICQSYLKNMVHRSSTPLNPCSNFISIDNNITNERMANQDSLSSNSENKNVSILNYSHSIIKNIYPNPAKNVLNLNIILTSGNYSQEVIIHDILGREMKRISLSSFDTNSGQVFIPIDIQEFNSGIYSVSLSENRKIIDTKLFNIE